MPHLYLIRKGLFQFFFLQFLSMKLATVYPEMNVQIDRILSNDVSSVNRI